MAHYQKTVLPSHQSPKISTLQQQIPLQNNHYKTTLKVNQQKYRHQHFDNVTSSNYDNFIVEGLLEEQYPKQIDILPIRQHYNEKQLNQLINANIILKKMQMQSSRIHQQQQRLKIKNRLTTLSQESKKILQKCKKKSTEHKSRWGHQIYGQQENKQQKIIQPNQSKNKQNHIKIQLKPIEQRIQQYKHKEHKLKQEQKDHQGLVCCHKQNNQQLIKQKQQKIQLNSKVILRQIKQKEKIKEEQEKIKDAKIRAIQLKSKQHIRKCKKKPLDTQGDFIFSKTQYSSFSQIGRKQKQQKIIKKKIEEQPISKKKIRKQGQYQSSKKDIKDQEDEQDLVPSLFNKFYMWDIPITLSDYEKIITNQQVNKINTKLIKKQKKTFKEQVDEYLSEKFKKQMIDERRKSNEQLFLDKVQQKKQQFLREFHKQFSNNKLQAIWNQDELFRNYPIQNFHFYS